jgi:integrase
MHFKVVKRYGGQDGWALKRYVMGKLSYVPAARWPAGLRKEMNVEQARAYIRLLNSSSRITGEEGARIAAQQRHDRRLRIQHALLPEEAVLAYERANVLFLPAGDRTRQKRENIWQSAQKMIVALSIHPADWVGSPDPLYQYMEQKRWSWDYCRRVFSALNRYGRIYCRQLGTFFEPIVPKDQRRRVAIEVAFGDGQESLPLGAKELTALKDKIPASRFFWLWVAFWFGLRPHEVDNLHAAKPAHGMKPWWTEDGGKTLVVYQPKLTKVKPKKRYKRIPVRLKAQTLALHMVAKGGLERPTQKQVLKWLPPGVSLYGCRHGFAVLMDQSGVDIYAISRWLGHQSVTTTERYYVRLGLRREAA